MIEIHVAIAHAGDVIVKHARIDCLWTLLSKDHGIRAELVKSGDRG